MLTNSQLRSQVDALWDKLWSGGLSNPLDAIEQLSYLIFLKRLDDEENGRQRQALRLGVAYQPSIPAAMRWSEWSQYKAEEALKHLKEVVFPWFRTLGSQPVPTEANEANAPATATQAENENSFQRYMQSAECKISKANLLIEACKLIDQMQISAQNQDVQGDLYEYLLNQLNTAGRNGQFRTPRHIIRMMVQMIDPQPLERIGDLAAGTAGFLVNAYQYILEQHTSPEILSYDSEGWPHHLIGDKLDARQRQFLQKRALRGYDNDSGMTMLRIGSMNLMLHGIAEPRFFMMDTLSKAYEEERDYDVILMNPPFKGAVDADDVNPNLPSGVKKSELLFVHLILRALDAGGRCAVIVPDGVLFGSSRAHIELRRKLVEENRLDGVLSMPSGVFKPYAGVSTAVLFFSKGGSSDQVWYYDMEHDGFSLDDKRQAVSENDIPDLLHCWRNRRNPDFSATRQEQLATLQTQITPLKTQRLRLEREINRLRFEQAIAAADDQQANAALDAAQNQLNQLQSQITPLQTQINRLSRHFWVAKATLAAHKYDLSASRYRQVERDEEFYEEPGVTLERLLRLDEVMHREMTALSQEIDLSTDR